MKQSLKTYLKVVLNLITALVALLLCIFLLPKCILLFMPFIVGWIIALIASPVVRFFEEKLKVRRKAVSALVIIAVLAVVVLLVYAVIAKLIQEGINFINELPQLRDNIMAQFSLVGENLQGIYNRMPADAQQAWDKIAGELGNFFSNLMGDASLPGFEAVGNVAKRIPDIFLAVVMCLLLSLIHI